MTPQTENFDGCSAIVFYIIRIVSCLDNPAVAVRPQGGICTQLEEYEEHQGRGLAKSMPGQTLERLASEYTE